ncbi:MAG: hypothetical protein EOP05_22125 [Proteobacteria bacterium]|nr:MAG: hypothetical protein EOP05_22125 [Pseudomonadota bacterium]
MKFIFAVLATTVLVLSGCAGKKVEKEKPAAPPQTSTEVESSEPSIDVWAIRRALKLERAPTELGYKEASFNTCEMGYGYSASSLCQRHTMAVINFRIQCRDTDGTVSEAVGASNLKAISTPIRWTIGAQNGVVTPDGEGYGQIVSIFPKPPGKTRIKLASADQFLYLMHASEASRVVVPKQWCD